MEIVLITIPFAIYVTYWVYFGDHDTPFEKDAKRFREGQRLFNEEKFEKSFDFFDQKGKIFPKSAFIWLMKGKCQSRLGNFHSSIFSFEQTLIFDNTVKDAYFEKGKSHFHLDDVKEAIYELDKASWHFQDKNYEILRWRSMCFYKIGKLKEAFNDIEKAALLGDERANANILSSNFFDYSKLI